MIYKSWRVIANMSQVWQNIIRHRFLFFLIGLAFAFRAGYLVQGVVPFAFDHGKDGLAIMDMVLNLSPKLVGPWTSIQGLYSGPSWYYLLAPFFLLFGFNPLAGAWTMVLLGLVQIVLAFKFLGKYEALLMAFAPLWMVMSRSAWNPYPITLISLVLVILFLRISETHILRKNDAFLVGFCSSLGFHFCAAYAFFYPLVILQALLLLRVRLNLKNVSALIVGFIVPFLPQLLFEIKNNFVETKAVLHYFRQGEPHVFGIDKIRHVLQTVIHETLLGFIPEMTYLGKLAWPIAVVLLIVLGGVLLKNIRRDKELQKRLIVSFAFVVLPVIGFFFLHFNLWYIYALVPSVIAVVGLLLNRSPQIFKIIFVGLLVIGQILWLAQYWQTEQSQLANSRGFLPTQLKTLNIIREKSLGKPFASYHYVRDVYDFTYQYLYFWQALQGQPLPTEFSYQPGETAYFVQKADLLKLFPQTTAEPEFIFYVVENPEQAVLLQEWWYRQSYSNIIETIPIGEDVTIYVGKP